MKKKCVRFLHSSDWHLGRFLYGKSLLEDQEHFLEFVLQKIESVRPHALLIAGDIFDRALPPESAVRSFDEFLSRVILQHGIHVALISGNHDSSERLAFGATLLRERRLTIFAKPEDAFRPVEVEGDHGAKVQVYGLPFANPIVFSRLLGREDLRSFDSSTRGMCEAMLKDRITSSPALLMCHGFVVGSETSESERELMIGGSSSIDVEAFAGFSYTALGHLHKPQSAGRENVRYSGSPLAYSKSEIGHKKSLLEVEIDDEGNATVTEHAITPKRALRYVEGKLDELVTQPVNDDYVIVGLTDPGPVLDAAAKLRNAFPSLLHVSRVDSFSPDTLPSREKVKERENLSELDLFSAFIQETTGQELSPEEKDLLFDVIRSVEKPSDEEAMSNQKEAQA